MNLIAKPTQSARFWLQSLSDGWACYDNKLQKFEARGMDWDEAQEFVDELEARLYGDDHDEEADDREYRRHRDWERSMRTYSTRGL